MTVAHLPGADVAVDVPRQVPMAAKGVELRPINPNDLRFLYELSLDPEITFRWRFRGLTPRFEAFVDQLYDASVLCQFLVSSRGQPVGQVVAYNADLNNGTVYVGTLARPAGGIVSPGVVATLLFCNYLFHNWNVRKVYFDTLGISIDDFGSAIDRAVELEGCMKDHHFYAGRYWHRYFLTLSHEKWESYVAPMVGRFAQRV